MGDQKSGFFSGTKGRVLAGGGIALAALVVISTQVDFLGSGQSVSGTIAPAERYRSSQAPDANVQAGSGGQGKSNQIDVGVGSSLANSAANTAANSAANSAANAAANAAANSAANAAAGHTN